MCKTNYKIKNYKTDMLYNLKIFQKDILPLYLLKTITEWIDKNPCNKNTHMMKI